MARVTSDAAVPSTLNSPFVNALPFTKNLAFIKVVADNLYVPGKREPKDWEIVVPFGDVNTPFTNDGFSAPTHWSTSVLIWSKFALA